VPENFHYFQTSPLVEAEHRRSTTPSDSTSKGPVTTYFQQPCPVCGRRLLIRVEHLGQQVSCSHCRCAFVARDVSQDRGDAAGGRSSVLDRAERLLASLESPDRSRRMCNV